MINENGVKQIRMGWKNGFIKSVILNDDTIIQNMQCSLNAKIPTDEELDKIDKENMKSKEEKVFDEFQRKECELKEIIDMCSHKITLDKNLIFDGLYEIYRQRDGDYICRLSSFTRLRKRLYKKIKK